jgi:hypothetical protein
LRGIPLWRLVGYVDAGVQHSEGAFSDDIAAGYEIDVSAIDGYARTFLSADRGRNDDIIAANELNIPSSPSCWA